MANNKALYPKRRELQKRISKRQPKLDKVFECLSCYNTKSVVCKLDFGSKVGTLACELCPARYACSINHLSKEVDVYSEWVDIFESLNQRQQQQYQQRPQPRVAQSTTAPAVALQEPCNAPLSDPTSSSASDTSSVGHHSTSTTDLIVSRTSNSQQQAPTSREQSSPPLESCEQNRALSESREKSRSPPQSREQTRTRTRANSVTSTRTLTPTQAHKEHVHVNNNAIMSTNLSRSPSPYYHDQNDDNASELFQQGGFNQPWTQGNNSYNNYSSHFYHHHYRYRQQGHDGNQGYGTNNHSSDSNCQDYRNIYQAYGNGGYQSYANNNQQYGGNHSQGYGNRSQQYGNSHSQGYGNHYQQYGANCNQGHGSNNQRYDNNSQDYGNNHNIMGNDGGEPPGYYFTRDNSPDRLGTQGRRYSDQ
ncbi:hypothetical protein EC991_006094 [Linnemannia zychae]|nr:hypothetical protein EC991_006094 [Linnemannia zychae]